MDTSGIFSLLNLAKSNDKQKKDFIYHKKRGKI